MIGVDNVIGNGNYSLKYSTIIAGAQRNLTVEINGTQKGLIIDCISYPDAYCHIICQSIDACDDITIDCTTGDNNYNCRVTNFSDYIASISTTEVMTTYNPTGSPAVQTSDPTHPTGPTTVDYNDTTATIVLLTSSTNYSDDEYTTTNKVSNTQGGDNLGSLMVLLIVIAVACILLVVCILTGYCFFGKNKKKQCKNNNMIAKTKSLSGDGTGIIQVDVKNTNQIVGEVDHDDNHDQPGGYQLQSDRRTSKSKSASSDSLYNINDNNQLVTGDIATPVSDSVNEARLAFEDANDFDALYQEMGKDNSTKLVNQATTNKTKTTKRATKKTSHTHVTNLNHNVNVTGKNDELQVEGS